MSIVKRISKLVFSLGILFVSCFSASATIPQAIEAISQAKIVSVNVDCMSFAGIQKELHMRVMDVLSGDVQDIFKDLKAQEFPIYAASCFAPRTIINGDLPSLHAYGAAIDVNYLMNPYFNIVDNVFIPGRNKDREADKTSIKAGLEKLKLSEEEINAVIKTVVDEQPAGSDDRFINRAIMRKGMVTQKVVETFKNHGFNIWGGLWRQPIDWMHFQLPRSLAEELAKTSDGDITTRKELWEAHKRSVLIGK